MQNISSQSPSGNYSGRIIDNFQGVKQFSIAQNNLTTWVYKKIKKTQILTPANQKTPVFINNDMTVSKDLSVYGSILNLSDEKQKENIVSLSCDDINDLFTLNPIIFSYKSNDTSKHYGFLAQEVQNVYPNLVKSNSEGYLSVNYQELIPIMIAKMKNMQEEIDGLKNKKI